MRVSQLFGRQKISSTRRPVSGRRPLVETLEGRQLLSSFTQKVFDVRPAETLVVGQHIGAPEALKKQVENGIIGNHGPGGLMVQGAHIGSPMIQGAHIGSMAIQGNHIGYEAVVPDSAVLRKH
jgi:hypothetical protein